jgi:hypothetical protein
MLRSLTKIINQVDKQGIIPNDWQKMQIRSIHKKGEKAQMNNKRGLFLTNNVSKVYERVVKSRNDENFRETITEWATGGVSGRAPIDNVLTATSVVELNNYLKRNTYLIFTDAEKCFDKLWLKDGVLELWRCGTDVRDCVMIKKLNETAEIVVKTPVGDTESFTLSDIVRQGSVYGPQICISSMDKVNLIGKDVKTYYSPTLEIAAVVFVDDVTGIGEVETANRLIYNCNIMEKKKKMTFNNKEGKTEYMVIGNHDEEVRTVSNQVKKGRINRVKEHKMLGTWWDETGKYMINNRKREERLQFMISTVKSQANPRNVGIYTVEARLNLADIVVIPSILYNAEAFPDYSNEEMKKLESIQLKILTGILEIPKTTPYCALLYEVGWWTMKARLAYKKLMLYHNIVRSDEKRTVKRMVKEQEKEPRQTTWNSSIQRLLLEYGIEQEARETEKSTWKKYVKEKITQKTASELREKCENSSKARFVRDDVYEKKEYLRSKVPLQTAKKILRTRMNMASLPGNYKGNSDGKCPLCEESEGRTEHYFTCKVVKQLATIWNVKTTDIKSSDVAKLKDVSSFIEKVEIMVEPGSR